MTKFFEEANQAVLTGSVDCMKAALSKVPEIGEGYIYNDAFHYFLGVTAEQGQTDSFDLLLAHPNQTVVKAAAYMLLVDQAVTDTPLSAETLQKLAKKISDNDIFLKETLKDAFDAVVKRQTEGKVVNQAVFTALADNGAPVGVAYLALQNRLFAEIAELQGKVQAVGDIYSAATRTPAPPKR